MTTLPDWSLAIPGGWRYFERLSAGQDPCFHASLFKLCRTRSLGELPATLSELRRTQDADAGRRTQTQDRTQDAGGVPRGRARF